MVVGESSKSRSILMVVGETSKSRSSLKGLGKRLNLG